MLWPIRTLRTRTNRPSTKNRPLSAHRPSRTRLGLTLLEGRDLPSAVAVGPEFTVVPTGGATPRMAMAPGGRFAVTWRDADADGYGVSARLFDADGTPLTDVLAVNTTTAGDQVDPDIAMDALGDFTVVWEGPAGNTNGVFAQRFAADGGRLGTESLIDADASLPVVSPAVALAPDGRGVVTWNGFSGGSFQVFALRLDAYGTPLDDQPIPVNTDSYQASASRAAANGDGFVVAWTGALTGTGGSTWGFVRGYTWDGTPRGDETRMAEVGAFPFSFLVDVGMAADDSFVATFNHYGAAGDSAADSMYAQRFAADGSRAGDTVLVNPQLGGWQVGEGLAVAADGSFVTAWGTAGDGVWGQRFDATGAKEDSAFRLSSSAAPAPQTTPEVATDESGNFTAIWVTRGTDRSYQGIYAQQYAIPQEIRSETATLVSVNDDHETMTVTTTVSTVGGSYLWNYHVHNDSFLGTNNAPPGVFTLAFDTTGVTNVSGSAFVGSNYLQWTGPTLAIGGEADFSFMTPPVYLHDLPAVAYPTGIQSFGVIQDPETANGQVLAPGILADSAGYQFWTANPNVIADELKVAKWQNSFQAGDDNTAQVIPNFLDLPRTQGDPDRFYIVVNAPQRNIDPNAKEVIKVRVGTSSDAGSVLPFEETDVNSGKFWSPYLMLVSNTADKMDPAVADYENRLFRVKLGDDVWASFGNWSAAVPVKVKYTQ